MALVTGMRSVPRGIRLARGRKLNNRISFRILAFVTLSVLGLAACSLKLKVVLFNDAGEMVIVHADQESISIKPLSFAKFDYPSGQENWALRMSVSQCIYTYSMPSTLEHYPWSGNSSDGVKMQISRDFKLYLVPPDSAGVVAISEFLSLQKDGFPLAPVEKKCQDKSANSDDIVRSASSQV